MSSDSESDHEFEFCSRRDEKYHPGVLPFEPSSIESIILKLCDNFNLRVVLSDERTKGAVMVTTGLALAGSLIGNHYGGRLGAAVGGTVGGVCGLGIVAVSMRDVWEDIKSRLSELFDLVYDYLSGMGIDDYAKAAMFLTRNSTNASQLTMLIIHTASQILGKEVLSSLSVA